MPGNLEEKEKCLEKLSQMQKFLPFLDFMIDKIEKKNNETSLECQLGKFYLLRSMIAEKNGKYSWNIIVKVEDVIQKLIQKLDYKEQYVSLERESIKGKTKDKESKVFDLLEKKTSMAAAISIIPSSTTTTISVTSASSSPQVTTVDSRPQGQSSSTNSVDLIMKKLKVSVDGSKKKSADSERGKDFLSHNLSSGQVAIDDKFKSDEVSEKTLETDLDKDLDGFDLPDFSEPDSSNNALNKTSTVSEKLSSHDDLLSSSREKLLKSLQKKLNLPRTDHTSSQSSTESKIEKPSELLSISAFSPIRCRTHSGDGKAKSETETGTNSENSASDKHNSNNNNQGTKSVHSTLPLKSFYSDSYSSDKKTRNDLGNGANDYNSKQKLREKLSADICEVYRVAGKSIGGSLRSLKDHKKTSLLEEEELFKPDKVTAVCNRSSSGSSRLSTDNKYKQTEKSQRKSSTLKTVEKKDEKAGDRKGSYKHSGESDGKNREEKHPKVSENKITGGESGKSSKSSWEKKAEKNVKDTEEHMKKEKKNKCFDLDNFDDNELLEFVKENNQSLPHLSKLKPSELRKAVESSLTSVQDVEEISEDSLQDLDEFINDVEGSWAENLKSNNETQPLDWVKISEVDSDDVTKNARPVVGLQKDEKVLDVIGCKTYGSEDVDSLDDEDFAQKLIEETTPQILPLKKKKGLLELPLPWSDDLLDEVTSPETPDYSPASPENRDPRLKKSEPLKKKNNKPTNTRTNSRVSSNADLGRGPNDWLAQKSHYTPVIHKESIYTLRPPGSFGPQNLPGRMQQIPLTIEPPHGDGKTESWHVQSTYFPQDGRNFPQISSRYPSDRNDHRFRNPNFYPNAYPMHNNDPTKQNPHLTPVPKSYAEYKRLKLQEQEKANQQEQNQKEKLKNISTDPSICEAPQPQSDKDDNNRNNSTKTPENRQHSNYKEIYSNQRNPKNFHSSSRPYEDRRKSTDKRRYSDFTESKVREDCRGKKTIQEEVRKEEDERRRKVDNDRRQSSDSEELVSPLERLYQGENKPKTGRGYGLQNFKIPKKVRDPMPDESIKASAYHPSHKETTSSVATKDETHTRLSSSESEVITPKESSEIEKDVGIGNQVNAVDTTTKKDDLGKIDEKTEVKKSDGRNIGEDKNKAEKLVLNLSTEPEISDKVQCDVVSVKEISNAKQTTVGEEVFTNRETKTVGGNESVRKCEAQIVECDSSVVESTNVNRGSPVKESQATSDRGAVVSKEEITQEFVETLIRKSFQSGEGKLLLAQAKLFEEFARKLNSKKLKTIQKIINSESDSSFSSSEASTEEEKKKKKSKKLEEKKSKRRKKKVKKSKKLKSSSSSSESEESNEDEGVRKKEEETSKESENVKVESSDGPTNLRSNEDSKNTSVEQATALDESKSNESAMASPPPKTNPGRTKKRRRVIDFGRCISRRKTRRKQGQKKLLEQILNETPQQENVETVLGSEVSSKESEQKNKPKTKGKVKTELDRLHDDIRSMFISSGVVTATGQRMCRILRESGGNMNNLDIVKESAKMVEEEKLKKVQIRVSSRKPARATSQESRSRSQSSDKITARDRSKNRTGNEYHSEDAQGILAVEMCKKKPYVVLERADLDNFGYGVKISDNCISFGRMRGSNTAIRGKGCRGFLSGKLSSRSSWYSNLERNVYLARNKRKCERLKFKSSKKGYVGKKIMDVVKNLPLKMSKMKHLEMRERKPKDKMKETKKRKAGTTKTNRRRDRRKEDENRKELLGENILNYAFEKRQLIYPCRLCTNVTRNITSHYKLQHPESEVLISRLTKTEAKKAIADSKQNCYDGSDWVKQRAKSQVSGEATYHCRMCNLTKITDLNTFFSHVSGHTGEYRFQCPSEGCGVTMATHGNIKFHILSKHSEDRFHLYGGIIELFPVPAESENLFGYLCSECNFVQISRSNVDNHAKTQHPSVENIGIIKIDMSSKVKKNKNSKKKTREDSEEKIAETNEIDFVDVETVNNEDEEGEKPISTVIGETFPEKTRELRKRKPKPVGVILPENSGEASLKNTHEDDLKSPVVKKLITDLDPREKGFGKDPVSMKSNSTAVDVPGEEKANIVGELAAEDSEADEYVDLNNISSIRGSDIIDSIEINDRKESLRISDALFDNILDSRTSCTKLKIGPLEAQTLENSEVLYECYVKGCLFSTKVYDLFEKHIKISHSTVKWDGLCKICLRNVKNKALNSKSLKLIYALKHLKYHLRNQGNKVKGTAENLKLELMDPKSSEESVEDDEDSSGLCINTETTEPATEFADEGDQAEGKSESGDAPFPVKPLLRVRNFFGDRLSKPKDQGEDDLGVNNESEEKMDSEPKIDAPAMFTIENVRSLNQSEKKAIQVGQACGALKNMSGKVVLVRSCPTRKIKLRPETSVIPIEFGHAQGLKAPTSANSDVLSPQTNNSSIRLISSLPPGPRKKKFTVKPVMVSSSLPLLANPSAVPVIHSVPSSTATTSTALPITIEKISSSSSAAEECSTAPQSVARGRNSTDAVKISAKRTTVYRPGRSASQPSAEVEEPEQKDATLQRLHSSPSVGNKSVKDAKIYQEMLTKTKLCHLFKCMAIECSFTCNSENVFTQHIGLHEAQRRMKRPKNCMKKIYLDSSNKMKKVFNWQQCAYCCEVLVNTSSALSQHIMMEHGHCIYQCAYCFYRAVSQSYVEIHQNLAHSQTLKNSSRVIYKCKQLSGAPPSANALEKQGRRQSVRPYHCDQCGSKFFITQEFMNHLTTEHQSVTAYTCHICKNLCFKADRLITHYKLHSYCTFQCAYCLHGTETEKEMVFHLCNFHFSQPAYMYVRALAEGQSDDGLKRSNKKKKSNNSQLDSLKVILYESDSLNPDCLVEADEEEETTNDAGKSFDFSVIVAGLGLNSDTSESSSVTPIMKELASIGNCSPGSLSLKSLLPNAQFSSENESGSGESCSVLISSGLSATSNEERDMNIPLGQLPLEAVNIQNKKENPPAKNLGSPDKNLKLNEIIINLQHKDKNYVFPNTEEEKEDSPAAAAIASATHKLPPVVVTRKSRPKNVYPPKNSNLLRKKSEESGQVGENFEEGNVPLLYQILSCDEKTEGSGDKNQNLAREEREESSAKIPTADNGLPEKSVGVEKRVPANQPIITNVVSLSNRKRKSVDEEISNGSLIISDICSMSCTELENRNNPNAPSKIVINIQSKVSTTAVLEPPIIRVEDFPINENQTESQSWNKNIVESEDSSSKVDQPEDNLNVPAGSPDVIILEEEKTAKDILTVTLDSEDEKEVEESSVKDEGAKATESVKSQGNIIRKEMELLRTQIANETDCLLFDDDSETDKARPEVPLTIKPVEKEVSQLQSLLSPIEEAICSLNKKLQSETRKNQEKVDEQREGVQEQKKVESVKKAERANSTVSDLPRTRSGVRDRSRREEAAEKSDSDDGTAEGKKEDKNKKFREGLMGKNLFICGNSKCSFAAEGDSSLKDHLYVCDLSRESSVLSCPHCFKQIKQFNPYIEHLKHHGEKKFYCGLCSFTSAVEHSTTRHVKQKHKCSALKSLPKDPPKEGHLVYYPKNYKVEKQDFEVNGYSPGDEDKLPLQSVYQVNVKCAKCPYFTKVRSNMVRHLKIHVKSAETEGVVVVPSTAPTNPVPCLDAKERMFDKMTNLAASSQMAQAKEKTAIESLSPEEQARLPQFVAEQMRYKCCLPDCNYITIDDSMLKHHIKALHDEISYYSCPHCKSMVHVDVRHVTLDKLGHHLKHHDNKLYKCAHCIYFHYQRTIVEKHTIEKHPDRRYYVHVVREPKPEVTSEEEQSQSDSGAKAWKCGLCDDFQSPSRATIMDHLARKHNTKSKYKCQLCYMKSNHYQSFFSHFASKHVGEKVAYVRSIIKINSGSGESLSSGADSSSEHFDTTPLWQRGAPRIRHIRGILIEEEEVKTKRSKRVSEEKESEPEVSEAVTSGNAFYCPLCSDKKKTFYTRSAECFRSHLYQELNYQQFACILCGKMFVDKKDFDKHHARTHPDKPQAMKQTKEDGEIMFWVDKVIEKQKEQMQDKKRRLSEDEPSQGQAKKKKEV